MFQFVSRVIAIFFASAAFAVGILFVESDKRLETELMTHQELVEHVSVSNSTGFFEAFFALLVIGSLYIGIIEILAFVFRWFWKDVLKKGVR